MALILGDNSKLYDSKKGQKLPEGISPMPILSDEKLAKMPEPPAIDVIPRHVARYLDLMGLAGKSPSKSNW